MRSFRLLSFALITFLLSRPPTTQSQSPYGHGNPRARRYHANKPNGYKRDANVVFTYFVDGLGACGATNSPSDFIVALNSAEYAGGAHCFEMITININGKTAQAQITDECVGCSTGGLDFSEGLFQYFAPLSEGTLYGSWSYNSDGAISSSTPATQTTIYTSSATTVATTTISSSTVLSTTTTTATPSASTIVPSQTSTTTIVPTPVPQDLQTIAQVNLALLELGSVLEVSFKLGS